MGLRLLRLDQCPHTDRGDAHSGRRKRESRRVEVSAGRRGPLSSEGPETDEGGCSLPPVLGRAERHLRSSRRPLHFAELGEELQRILPAYGVSDARASMAIARRGFSSSRRGYIPRGTESVSAPRHGTSVRAGGCTTCPGLARSRAVAPGGRHGGDVGAGGQRGSGRPSRRLRGVAAGAGGPAPPPGPRPGLGAGGAVGLRQLGAVDLRCRGDGCGSPLRPSTVDLRRGRDLGGPAPGWTMTRWADRRIDVDGRISRRSSAFGVSPQQTRSRGSASPPPGLLESLGYASSASSRSRRLRSSRRPWTSPNGEEPQRVLPADGVPGAWAEHGDRAGAVARVSWPSPSGTQAGLHGLTNRGCVGNGLPRRAEGWQRAIGVAAPGAGLLAVGRAGGRVADRTGVVPDEEALT